MSFWAIVDALRSCRYATRVHDYKEIDSTQAEAMRLVEQGAPHGTVVVADAQTAGKGRVGRSWHSPPGVNLYMSFIWRPFWPATRAPLATLQAAVATARAIERSAEKPGLKWPNDVLLHGKKVAGILTELKVHEGQASAIVFGVGINVAPMVDLPPELRLTATSLAETTGRQIQRFEVAEALTEEFGKSFGVMANTGAYERAAWMDYQVVIGQDVTVYPPGEAAYHGVAVDLGEGGELVVAVGDERRSVVAGDVSLRLGET